MNTAKLHIKLTADPILDAHGYTTIREWDGTQIGNIDVDSIATVYDSNVAEAIVSAVNSHTALVEALECIQQWSAAAAGDAYATHLTQEDIERELINIEACARAALAQVKGGE